MQSFAEFAKQGIKKHPEIFSALLDFEKTGKVEKFIKRKRMDITINEEVLREFRNYCQKHGLNMSRVLEKHMIEEIS